MGAASAIAPDPAGVRGSGVALGVIVPCRDEAAVIVRKLLNLARCEWPDAARTQRVVVVDDHSRDGTFDLASAQRDTLRRRGVALEVVRNDGRPGKPGAIATALRRLAGQVDLFVLTDADVALEPAALCALARAFERDTRLGLACGAQRFVRELADDGAPRAPDGGEPRPAAALYDRLTARVRQLESRAGRLFSVHGELLAWRAALALDPTPGFAADDLDLMLQARLSGARVELVREARFLEVKLPAGEARSAQALRRARAYVQFLAHPSMERLAAHGSFLERAQVWAYRRLPTSAPWWIPLGVVTAWAVTAWWLPPRAVLLLALALAAACASPLGRRLTHLLALIRSARAREREAALADHWETPRA